MATITTTTSLSFDAAASLTVGVDKNFEGRIAFTSANDDVWPSFTVTKPQSKTYGPFGIAMTVVITVVNGSLDYTINGGNGGFGYDTDGNITGLVSGDGAQWLIPGAATFTASDAGTDWYRVPDVLQVAATLDSGTSTTVLVEVRTAAGVVSTALTITADTVAQTLRNSILTREMHEFRIRRSSGTGTVTVIV